MIFDAFGHLLRGVQIFMLSFFKNVYSPIEIDVEPSQVNDTGTP